MEKKLPKFYRPEILRKAEPEEELEIRYGVGIDYSIGGVGMTNGPFEEIYDCLEIVGESDEYGIYELPSGKKLYRWEIKKECWVKI